MNRATSEPSAPLDRTAASPDRSVLPGRGGRAAASPARGGRGIRARAVATRWQGPRAEGPVPELGGDGRLRLAAVQALRAAVA